MSLSFNGTSSKLVMTSGSLSGLNGYPFTIAAWIKPNTQSQGCVVGISGPSTVGYFGIAADDQWGIGMCGIQGNGASWWKDTAALDSANWHVLVHVRTSQAVQRTYYKSTTGTGYTNDLPLNMSGLNALEIGNRGGVGFYSGLLAHVTIWTAALSSGDVVSLQGGAHPTTVQSGSLFEYWSLLTQASTQTGTNGRVLTATSTSEDASNPSVNAPSSGSSASKTLVFVGS